MALVAILIDGGFFLKRFGTVYPGTDARNPDAVAQRISWLIGNHLDHLNVVHSTPNKWSLLYRAFYYDARPYLENAQYPISKMAINYSRSADALFRLALFDKLRHMPNMAVRLGDVRKNSDRSWILKPAPQADLLAGRRAVADLTDQDFSPALRQKGVDMRIGIDMASLSLKAQVDTIILVTGDADFVPAAKLARREGVRIILDPLWQNVDAGLFEHIDGVYSGVSRPPPRAARPDQG